MIFKVGDDI